ncbi:MAG: DUF3142 domain-containing protein [Acidobacteria bacterium]|nr:DUF3142 domain-containing protein [Acidobacteriota bacterium]
MHISNKLWNYTCIASIALFVSFAIRSDALPQVPGRMAALPRITLWAWERREDLRSIDPQRYAIAYLDRTITIGSSVDTQIRRNSLAIPESAKRIPVVRIEAPRTAMLTASNRADAVTAILDSATETGAAALQIDFDATASQRTFYRDILADLREKMPPNLPLSITALASWCSWDNWISGLPVDEAVPMMFRMEPDHRLASPIADDFVIREPLCRNSYGISTTEPWPSNLDGKRLYIFADNGWRADSPNNTLRRLR